MLKSHSLTLHEIAEIIMGQSPVGESCNRSGTGYPLLNGPTEFGSHHPTPTQFTVEARKFSKPGDILFCVRGSTTGRMNWSDQVYAIGRGIAAIRHKSNPALQPLLRAIIDNYLPQLLQVATGSTFPNVSAGQLAAIPFPVLSESVAVAYASTLGALDDKIELNRRMNETLEAMAQAIFKDWFVDFGPTRAKMEGRPPYLQPAVWRLFPSQLDAQGIPVGWRFGELQELVDLNPQTPLSRGTIAPYLDMAALPTGGSIADRPVPREFQSGSKFRNGDTLFARITPCLENGKTAFLQTLPDNTTAWGSTEFIVMRSKPPVPAAYTYLLARDAAFRTHAIQSMTGTTGRQRARTEAISQYRVAIPPREVWLAFDEVLNPLFERISANGQEALSLAETRDLLLPKLMSGEILIKNAEGSVGEAT